MNTKGIPAFKVVTRDRKSMLYFYAKVNDTRLNRILSMVHRQGLVYKYIPGTIVKAKSSSRGIFCFKSKEAAERWIYACCIKEYLILNVIGYGVRRSNSYLGFSTTTWERSYAKRFISNKVLASQGLPMNVHLAPRGTICFSEVEVLD